MFSSILKSLEKLPLGGNSSPPGLRWGRVVSIRCDRLQTLLSAATVIDRRLSLSGLLTPVSI